MITIILKGGLGNNLFQYALAKNLSIINGTKILFDISGYVQKYDIFRKKYIRGFRYFKINQISYTPRLDESVLRRLGLLRKNTCDAIYREKLWGFDPDMLRLGDGVILDGFFQSEKYFKEVEQVIREDLSFKNDSYGKEFDGYKEIINNTNSVGVHVRRGDYLQSGILDVCDISYYERAVEYMQNRLRLPQYFVFSDDIQWCAENLHMPNCRFVSIKASRNNPVVDMQLMSLCKHNIIPNSTYSWWAAWLNENHGKIVVAPDRWANHEEMNVQALKHTLPEHWIKLAVR